MSFLIAYKGGNDEGELRAINVSKDQLLTELKQERAKLRSGNKKPLSPSNQELGAACSAAQQYRH